MNRRGGDNIFLVGPMGSGKSTVGRALAKLLGCEFVDTDRWIERRAGRPIHEIFSRSGEAAFRKLERAAVAKAARGRGRVVAVGGGAVIDPANRRAMSERGAVVYLEVSAETALRRACAEGLEKRPLLSAEPKPLAAMKRLLAERAPLYRRCADFKLRAGTERPDSIAKRIAGWVCDAH